MQRENFFTKNNQKGKRENIVVKIFTDKNNKELRFFYKFPGYYGLIIVPENNPNAIQMQGMKKNDFIEKYFYLINYNIVFNINNFMQFLEKNKNNKILIVGYGDEGGSAFGEFIVNEVKKDKNNQLTLNDIFKIKNSNLIKGNSNNIQIEDKKDGFEFLKNNQNKGSSENSI